VFVVTESSTGPIKRFREMIVAHVGVHGSGFPGSLLSGTLLSYGDSTVDRTSDSTYCQERFLNPPDLQATGATALKEPPDAAPAQASTHVRPRTRARSAARGTDDTHPRRQAPPPRTHVVAPTPSAHPRRTFTPHAGTARAHTSSRVPSRSPETGFIAYGSRAHAVPAIRPRPVHMGKGSGSKRLVYRNRAADRFSTPRGETLLLLPPQYSKTFKRARGRLGTAGDQQWVQINSVREKDATKNCIKHKMSARLLPLESSARRCSGSKFFCAPGTAVQGRSSRAPSPARPSSDLDHAFLFALLVRR